MKPGKIIIIITATEWQCYFSVVLAVMLYKVVIQILSVRMNSRSVTIQIKFRVQYLPLVLFVMLYKVVLPFECEDEILKCDHLNESY